MKFYGKAEEVANNIIERFKAGEVPRALALVFIRRQDKIPCREWSWSNQFLTALAGHSDARTYLEWQRVGRQVRKGEKSFLILEPCKKKMDVVDKDTGAKDERMITYGFRAGARFGREQTDVIDVSLWVKSGGADLEADRFLEALPLVEVARHWDIRIASYNGSPNRAAGQFSRDNAAIAIGVENIAVWAHELMHAADYRLGQLVEKPQHWRSETVAELGAHVLLHCIGREHDADLGACWSYIEHYAKSAELTPAAAMLSVLSRTCKCVASILETADALASMPIEVAA